MPALTQEKYQQYLEALLAGNRRRCQETVQSLLDAGKPVYEIYAQLFQRSLYQIGDMWETNQITVATEHLATSLTESLLNMVYPQLFASERIGKSVILACVANELHPIGSKMVADIFELNGWDSYFLGANVPVSGLLTLIEEKKPDLLGLSVSLFFNVGSLQKTLQAVIQTYPDLPIIVGGHAFLWGGTDCLQAYPDVRYIDSLETLISAVIKA